MPKDIRILKLVFTLKSGKSIVVSMTEEQAFYVYEQWLNFVKDSKNDVSKIKIDKKKDDKVVEVVTILLSEIAAIQIVDSYNNYDK